ncbi:MAG: hypothetical protein MJA84_07180 [Firmicutes bacterium]|nr:hypothetical protein [Bacillota bacterium]
MAELTAEMVQRRYETVASGTYAPEIPGLPDLVFVKMGLAQRGHSSRAYSAKLKELYAAGGYFSEALLPTILEKACRENGLDVSVLKKQRDIMKRLYDSIPPELAQPYDQLTPEEVTLLSPEEQAERRRDMEEHGRRIMEWANGFYTDEDRAVMEQTKQIEALEQHLKAQTAEHYARKHQMETEILLCARKTEDTAAPYFADIEDIQGLEDRNRQGLVQLYIKWKQFKEGLLPDFFRPDSTH